MSSEAPWYGDCPLGIALGTGYAVSVAGCSLASAIASSPGSRLAVLAAVILLFAATLHSLPGAVLTAVIAWLCYVGFLVNERGELSWDGSRDVTVLVSASLAGTGWWLVPTLIGSLKWRRTSAMADLVLLALTVAVFVVLGLVVKAVGRL